MSKTDDLRRLREARASLPRPAKTPDPAIGYVESTIEGLGEDVSQVKAYEDAPAPRTRREKKEWARAPLVEGFVREGTPAQRLDIRLRAGERGELVLAADKAGLPLSAWAREVLLKEARK